MTCIEYGRHCSGYERPVRARRFSARHPRLMGVALGVLVGVVWAGASLWMLYHPNSWGNLVALGLQVWTGVMLLLPLVERWAAAHLPPVERLDFPPDDASFPSGPAGGDKE